MSACNFTIPFSGAPSTVLSKAKSAIQNQGGGFQGDDMQGIFQVNVLGSAIKGSYVIAGQDINITIDSKPFLVPCSTIESFLRQHLA